MVFLYKLAPGPAGASFGLNVALMAGLPPSVVARASTLASGRLCQGRADHSGVALSEQEAANGDSTTTSRRAADVLKSHSALVSALRDVMKAQPDQNAESFTGLQGKVKQALDSGS